MEIAITPDERWKIFYGINTYQEFIEKFDLILYLNPQASSDIKGIFHVIQQLLLKSYLEYEFVDVAAIMAKIRLETVLKIRYQELTEKIWPVKKTYSELLEWFAKGKYFEWDSVGLLNHVRMVRNMSVHATLHSYAGMMSLQHVLIALDFINDTFEDPLKRKQRATQTKSLNLHLKTILESGCLLTKGNSAPEMIYLIESAFVNNKREPSVTHLFYKSIFPIPKEYKVSDSITLYAFECLACNYVDLGENYFIGLDQDRKEVFKLITISDVAQQETWNTWKANLDKYKSVMVTFDHSNLFDIEGHIVKIKRDFYKD